MTRPATLAAALVSGAILLASLAILAPAGSESSVAFGALAVASAGGALGLAVRSKVREERARPEPGVAYDPLGRLRGALDPGSLGRERVVFELQMLEFELGGRTGATWSPEELRTILGATGPEFRAWLEPRLRKVEDGS